MELIRRPESIWMGRDNPEVKLPLPSLLAGTCLRSLGGQRESAGACAEGGGVWVRDSRDSIPSLRLALNLPGL